MEGEIGLFRLAEQRLDWVDRRQRLLAHNVANANTPGFQPKDVAPFEAVLPPGLAATAPLHMAGTGRAAGEHAGGVAERSPSGNTVSLEAELAKVADTASTQELVLNLHRKYQGMMRLALGRG